MVKPNRHNICIYPLKSTYKKALETMKYYGLTSFSQYVSMLIEENCRKIEESK